VARQLKQYLYYSPYNTEPYISRNTLASLIFYHFICYNIPPTWVSRVFTYGKSSKDLVLQIFWPQKPPLPHVLEDSNTNDFSNILVYIKTNMANHKQER
jgi:hypothetical protein